ncbi:hypothetical protein SH661x_000994 [Planctomicrobium sp. SH661]|uniref:hypothetical protein n=1 Tax=Planctomicrobium sp. SH661 TaxID=3448124 RepID=UPI003F5BF4D9
MSYVGKILVIVQVVLSLLFMTFAGGVYAVHQNWRVKYENSQKSLQDSQTKLSAAQEAATNAERKFRSDLDEQTQLAEKLRADVEGLQASVVDLTQKNALLTTQRATQTGVAEAMTNEAKFRQEEAEKQRIENGKLQSKVNELYAENRELKDQIFTKDQSYKALNNVYESGLVQLNYLKQLVSKHGMETDPEVVAKMNAPAPPVDGLVTQLKKNKAGRVQFVEISIGSDDGLTKSNELDVIRTYGTENRSDWLGRIRVVDLGPDWAVGEVILPAKNGIIQEGDNVTTKLGL